MILRYEIERDLINGKIKHTDPELWNNKMQTYLGLSTEGNYRNGCIPGMYPLDRWSILVTSQVTH